MLIHLYSSYTDSNATAKSAKPESSRRTYRDIPLPNGHAPAPNAAVERQARDAQEFELEALMSDDEDEGESHRKPNSRS